MIGGGDDWWRQWLLAAMVAGGYGDSADWWRLIRSGDDWQRC